MGIKGDPDRHTQVYTDTQISLTIGGDDSGMASCGARTTISFPHTRNDGEISRQQYWALITASSSIFNS